MKRLTLSILLLIFSIHGYAQCTADAGPDKIFCVPEWGLEPEQLGGDPAASNGAEPYSYTWETSYTMDFGDNSLNYTASDFLNDTTLANPIVTNAFEFPLVFKLTVTDDLGQTCTDSVEARFSIPVQNLGQIYLEINAGDSVQLSETNIVTNYPPFEYFWQPSHGLTDNEGLGVWAKPDSSISYYTAIIDSAGCYYEGGNYFIITVLPVGIQEMVEQRTTLNCYPNPMSKEAVIEVQNAPAGKLEYELLDASGRQIWHQESNSRRQIISRNELSMAGAYVLRIMQNGNLLSTGKIVVE